ncbi:MAG: hypothetical protein VKJ46_04645 [Leptolyngbyaceae bacterium]|nr:hypothetical protein [Leptolyngbyaceae bacterium]
MAHLSSEEIAQFRSKLSQYPNCLIALDAIEDCEGDLEDAAIVLAIRSGQDPDIANSQWLDGLARQCRASICREEFSADLQNGLPGGAIADLATTGICPPLLATPVVIYVIKQGIHEFCNL